MAPPSVAAASSPGAPAVRRLGRYELLNRIAGGGMATVYVGRARGAGGFARLVAIKVCHPHLREDRAFAEMFLDEARLAAQIHHPNVVDTLDVVDEADELYLVMDYIEGDRLLGLLRTSYARGERVPLPVVLAIAQDMLAGLHAAHELRDPAGRPLALIHRDVSPHNVLVGTDGVTRLADFGVAKAAARAAATTREGELKGKLPYMAPEQLRRDPVDRRVDLFAAGVVLWEALAGEPLFHGESELATMQNVLERAVPAPSTYPRRAEDGAIPAALDAVVLRALARDPAARFATALAMSDALEACGVQPAAPRAVAAYVEKLLGESIAQRREQVRRAVLAADEGAAPGASAGVSGVASAGAGVGAGAVSSGPTADEAREGSAVRGTGSRPGAANARGSAPDAAGEPSTVYARGVPRRGARGVAWLALGVAAVVLAGGVALVAFGMRGTTRAPEAARVEARPEQRATSAGDGRDGAGGPREQTAVGASGALETRDAGTASGSTIAPIANAGESVTASATDAGTERRGRARRTERRRQNEYEPSGI